jgi:hypothetical protein
MARPDASNGSGSNGPPHETAEEHQHLLLLAASPTIWAAHFLASYLTAAIWCAKAGRLAGLDGVRWAIATFTVAALAGIVVVGLRGLRRHRLGSATVPHDFDTPEDRHRFLGFATVLLSALSVVAVVYVALPAVFFGACW